MIRDDEIRTLEEQKKIIVVLYIQKNQNTLIIKLATK